jgi:rhamnosyltransferase
LLTAFIHAPEHVMQRQPPPLTDAKPDLGVKLAVLVVFYHPNPLDLGLLDQLQAAGMPSYLIDNTPTNEMPQDTRAPTLPPMLQNAPFVWVHRGQNIGLSRAYNKGFAQARRDGCTHVLVFDQDTRIGQQTLSFITQTLTAHLSMGLGVGAGMGMLNFGQKPTATAGIPQAKLLVINSATAFDLACHSAVAGFDERYFVDCVDYDYCWRCLKAGMGVYQVQGTPGLDHLSGQPGKSVRILGKTLFARSYGARRNAEILRGHLRLLAAGIAGRHAPWCRAILRSLILFWAGRIITFVVTLVTFFQTGKT